MNWVFENAGEKFDQYRQLWDELNKIRGNHILLDSSFVSALIRYFGSSGVLLGISLNPSSPGLVLVARPRNGLWQTFQPSQEPLGLILLGNADGVVEQTETLISNLSRYAWCLSILQQDPDFTVFNNLNGYGKAEFVDYIKTARLTLRGPFEEWWKHRGKNLVHNIARQRRRLQEQGGKLRLVVDREPGHVRECIEEYGRLEGGGWKAAEKTAVTAENQQGLFYRELFESFCGRGEGVIYRLLLNGRTMASDLCLERDEMLVVLKTAYDESITGISPGLLLHQEIFKDLFAQGKVKVVEFYGPVREWHLKWTNEVRTMYHVNFYRNRWISTIRQSCKKLSRSLASGPTTE